MHPAKNAGHTGSGTDEKDWIMRALIQGKPLSGKVQVPPSKSVAHRILICAALSGTPCVIKCSSINRDIEATADCLNALGANITYVNGKYKVKPISTVIKNAVLDCGESGSTLRFMLPVAAALGADAVFIGHGRLPERPLSPLYDELVKHGICLSENGKMPLKSSGILPAGTYTIDGGVSSQFISGLLMALPLTGKPCKITITGKRESASYIGLTINALDAFGIKVKTLRNGYFIPGEQKFKAPSKTINVEGDWSSAAFWLANCAIGEGKETIHCSGINYYSSAQGDRRVVDILRQMGAKIETKKNTTIVHPSQLKASIINCKDVPDLVPILAVAASKAKGTTVFKNTSRLRIKESDRIESVLSLLHSAGIEAKATKNTLSVTGKTITQNKKLRCSYDPSGDHRMAMSAAILASVQGLNIDIKNVECTEKSYPSFMSHIQTLGADVRLDKANKLTKLEAISNTKK
jgi:3-phosphoshikimate 1-carboxyvinyltransferase